MASELLYENWSEARIASPAFTISLTLVLMALSRERYCSAFSKGWW